MDTPIQLCRLSQTAVKREMCMIAIPLSGERIPAEEKFAELGNKQLKKIFKISSFSDNQLSVLVADSLYSQRNFIGEQVSAKKLSYDYKSQKQSGL